MNKHSNTVFILKKVREQAVRTQSLEQTIKYINDYIEQLEEQNG